LLAFFVVPYPARGMQFPVGPDAPVYIWWARIAEAEGLSAAGLRPGVSALSLVLSGITGLGASPVLASLAPALGASIGLAAMTLVWPEGRVRGWLAGAFCGTFAAHLAGGYFANLAFVTLFLATLVALRRPGRTPSMAGAAGLLAAGGLTHPLFFLLGAAILTLATGIGFSTRTAREDEARRVGMSLAGGAGVAGLGLAATLIGPGLPVADSSKDAFLRRAGLGATLRGEYVGRLTRLWARFVLPVSVPLAWLGLRSDVVPHGNGRSSFLHRVLLAWAAVTAAGVTVSLVTRLFPPVRFLSFAYVLPLGAAVAIPWIHSRLSSRGRIITGAVSGLLVAALLAGATFTWWRQDPFIHEPEVDSLAAVAAYTETLPPVTPLVFVVDDDDPELIFLSTLAGNVIRAAMPPERIRDVHLYVGTPALYLAGEPTLVGDPEHDAISRLYLEDIRAAGGEPVAFVVAAFNRPGIAEGLRLGRRLGPGVALMDERAGSEAGTPADPLQPFSSWSVVLAGVVVLALLTLVGLGWALAALGPAGGAAATAPAFGAAALILAGVATDRVGIRLDGAVPALIGALAAGGGYLVAWALRLQREAVAEPVS
jgi:hypothetical protein